MTRTSAARAARSVTAVSVLTIAGAAVVRLFWLAGLDALSSARASGPDAPADLLVVGAAAVGIVLVAWLAIGLVLAALAAVPGVVGRCAGAAADRVAPAVVRRLAAAVVGTALVTAVSPAAHADGWTSVPHLTMSSSSSNSSSSRALTPAPDPAFVVTGRPPVTDPAPAPGTRAAAVTAAPDPGFGAAIPPSAATPAAPSVPEAPSSRPRTAPALGPLGPAPHTDAAARRQPTVTVVRGDSLWVIAARHLGPHATPQEIAKEWPRWYAANRTVIGSDPNLIHVGQVLTAPSPGATS